MVYPAITKPILDSVKTVLSVWLPIHNLSLTNTLKVFSSKLAYILRVVILLIVLSLQYLPGYNFL